MSNAWDLEWHLSMLELLRGGKTLHKLPTRVRLKALKEQWALDRALSRVEKGKAAAVAFGMHLNTLYPVSAGYTFREVAARVQGSNFANLSERMALVDTITDVVPRVSVRVGAVKEGGFWRWEDGTAVTVDV